MVARLILLLALALPLAGCPSTGGPALRPGCEWTKFIFIKRGDVVPDSSTEAAIFEHNEARAAICGGP